uniref:CSON010589 protein n=1 Tax=Culicoides sonorensis TaxID=179676 RepID=A0A336KLV3_CULSO
MSSRPKIYVNPNFTANNKVHINPNFLPKIPTETVVHVNPLFLLKNTQILEEPPRPVEVKSIPAQQLIRKTRHKLLRIKNNPGTTIPEKNDASSAVNEIKQPQMIKLGRNKLVKANIYSEMKKAPPITSQKFQTSPKLSSNRFKKDNRIKVVPSKTVKSRHKSMILKRINGTVYKTSTNRLERQSSRTVISNHPSKQSDRLISMNGNKFILKEGGKRLIPIKMNVNLNEASTSKSTLEIAGIRFLRLTDGTYIRHHNHSSIVRQHLTTSKHKSIKILTNKLRKCNIPCAVFKRIGKCLAFTRGRCPKLHDAKYVDICVGALRKGGCTKTGCLLSHDLSLNKMPVCKYFLDGCCTNDNCPYLHNKLNENVPLCPEFLKGFCEAADQCDKRHEHIEMKQKLLRNKRKITRNTKNVPSNSKIKRKSDVPGENELESSSKRYFIDEQEKSEYEIFDQILREVEVMPLDGNSGKEANFSGISMDDQSDARPPIGSLPAFIPI